MEETDLSTAEAFKQVRACLSTVHLQSAVWMPGLSGISDTVRRLHGLKREAQECRHFQGNAEPSWTWFWPEDLCVPEVTP